MKTKTARAFARRLRKAADWYKDAKPFDLRDCVALEEATTILRGLKDEIVANDDGQTEQ